MHAQVVKLFGEGKYDEALPLAKRVLEIREKALPPDHQLIDVSLANLAAVYTEKRKHNEAEPLYQKLLGRYEKSLGLKT